MPKKKKVTFDYKKDHHTRGGEKVVTHIFTDKIMGVIIDADGTDGSFCSWDLETGNRKGCDQSQDHIQDLINVTE